MKLRRYLLFTGNFWESRAGLRASFGWDNFAGSFSQKEQAIIKGIERKEDCFHVIDSRTGDRVYQQEKDPDKESS